jgi:hypothetical protein
MIETSTSEDPPVTLLDLPDAALHRIVWQLRGPCTFHSLRETGKTMRAVCLSAGVHQRTFSVSKSLAPARTPQQMSDRVHNEQQPPWSEPDKNKMMKTFSSKGPFMTLLDLPDVALHRIVWQIREPSTFHRLRATGKTMRDMCEFHPFTFRPEHGPLDLMTNSLHRSYWPSTIKGWQAGGMEASKHTREYFLCQAAEHGYLGLLKYSQTLSPPMELSDTVIYYASKGGDMDVIRWLYDTRCPGYDVLSSYSGDARHAEWGDDRGLYSVAAFLYEKGLLDKPPQHHTDFMEYIMRAHYWVTNVGDATPMEPHDLGCDCDKCERDCDKCELRGQYNKRFGPYSDPE